MHWEVGFTDYLKGIQLVKMLGHDYQSADSAQ